MLIWVIYLLIRIYIGIAYLRMVVWKWTWNNLSDATEIGRVHLLQDLGGLWPTDELAEHRATSDGTATLWIVAASRMLTELDLSPETSHNLFCQVLIVKRFHVAATVSYSSPYCNSFVLLSSHGATRVMNKNRSLCGRRFIFAVSS